MGTKVEETPVKSHQVATMLTLSAITAMTGVDRFYLGYIVMGALKAISFGGGGIWARVLEGCPADQAKSLADAINDTGDAAKDTGDAVADDAAQWLSTNICALNRHVLNSFHGLSSY